MNKKRDCLNISMECSTMFSRDKKDFLRRFETVDETWIHYNALEIKEQSKECTAFDESKPEKAKVMVTTFGCIHGVIHIDYR